MRERPDRVVAVENSEHWLPAVSRTFHGRDIMAPVAAAISLAWCRSGLARRCRGS